MSRLFSSIIFSFFLLFQSSTFADEGDMESLVVPDGQESHPSELELNTAPPTEETILAEDLSEGEIKHLEVPELQETHTAQTEPELIEESTAENVTEGVIDESSDPVQEAQAEQELAQNNTTDSNEAYEQQVVDGTEAQQEPQEELQEGPSAEELEARHAEEAELREVGAGEEPVE